MNWKVEPVLKYQCILGEGPVWDPTNARLLWVDILNGEIHQWFPNNGIHKTFKAEQYIGAVALTNSKEVIAACQKGFYKINLESKVMSPIFNPESQLPNNRFNDGKCDPAGRFLAGTMSMSNVPQAGKLYALEADHSVRVKIDQVTCSNGMAWSADSRTFYYIDTGLREVAAFDYNLKEGSLHNKKVIISIPREEGIPDGMTIDRDGMLWVALWNGGKVNRYDPKTGKLLLQIALPVSLVTSCTFGGRDLTDLYITSASTGLNERDLEKQPLAGSLFVIKNCGFQGFPPHLFSG